MGLKLSHIPERTVKPRNAGITMVMDKGLSLRQAEDLISASGSVIDYIKIGFGTALVTQQLEEKLKLYAAHGVQAYLGGTLFEAALVRNQVQDYADYCKSLGLQVVEISDGSIQMNHDEKCNIIKQFSSQFKVLSEVGSKEVGVIIHPSRWIKMMSAELQAGAFKVIAEARESGTVGIFHKNGNAHKLLIQRITQKIQENDIIWETPQKAQQVYFIKLMGANVNLGNIATDEVIALEALRIGLRGDTFHHFLPKT
ncbi:MAG: hypothetical protein RIR05_1622 [Bacteroidota bacterium]|jgi:phosphosulfolactate synthase|nr:phosphosulfolactate synthase [Sphingobacteriia bacterium]